MKLVLEFLNNAKHCLAMASKAGDARIRAELEEVARQWTELAKEREKVLKSISESKKPR